MARYVTVNGIRTWYDERGDGDPVVLLHGGFSDSRAFTGNLAALADRFRVFTPDRRGHGRTPDVDGPITVDLMAQDTAAFLDEIVDGPAHVVGYSVGAMVAMYLALSRPDLVRRLVLISGAFDRDGWIFLPDAGGQMPPAVVEAYGEVSPDGVGHFPMVFEKIARAANEGPYRALDELTGITARTLVMAADDDLVHTEHTVALYRHIPTSELAVVPGVSHALLDEKPHLCHQLVAGFLTTDPVPTMIPIRRAPAGAPS